MQALPPETLTLYAELLERLRAYDGARSFASLPGSFTRKLVEGTTYWYFKTSAGPGRQREFFVGPDDKPTRAVMDVYAAHRQDVLEMEEQIERLCAMLRTGGAQTLDSASARVIAGLANAGIFRLGAVLVGTHAFIALSNALGVKWSSALRTQDIDLAAARILQLAVPQQEADLPRALESLNMGFLPVPGLDSREPETSFKVRGHTLRVDLLTPASGPRRSKPVIIERLKAAAQPVEFLDYLLENPVAAAVVNGGASLVSVPDPARLAVHKLIVADIRSVSFQAKSVKDREQASQLLEFLYAERRGDLRLAVEGLNRQPNAWRVRARRAFARIPDRLSAARKLLTESLAA